MKLHDILHLTYLQYRSNRARHILCSLAVCISVFAMLLLTNIGSFASNWMAAAFSDLGLQGMTIYLQEKQNGETLTPAFAEFLQDEVSCIEAATPVKFQFGTYKSGYTSGSLVLVGAQSGIEEAISLELKYGRTVFGNIPIDMQNPVVISDRFARTMFGRENVIGKQFYIAVGSVQNKYTVCGVVHDQLQFASGMLGGYMPEIVYVPLHQIMKGQAVDQILIQSDQNTEELQATLQAISSGAFGMQSEVAIQDLSGYQRQLLSIADRIKQVFWLLAGISMVVAAFGIENSMLSAIREMREELLLYRVIGIRRKDLVRLILMQSIAVCIAGALIGIVIGAAIIHLVQLLFLPGFTLSLRNLFFIFICVFLLGITSAGFPIYTMFRTMKKELYD